MIVRKDWCIIQIVNSLILFQMDEEIRNQYENKLVAQYARREEEREKENICKRNEYREYLLKQIGDKEKLKQKKNDNYTMQPFSEELTDPTE